MVDHKFEVLETPVRCTKCGNDTTVVFTGRVCSVCAGVWSAAQRAGMEDALREPHGEHRKPAGEFRSPEDRYKAARGSQLENIDEDKY